MAGISVTRGFDQSRLAGIADGLVIAVAVSLPWSTSATAVLAVLWLFAVIPTLRWAEVRRELTTAAGGLPVILVALGLAGMLWADVTLLERWRGLDSFAKLLLIPLLLAQFRRSGRGDWVFAGYLFSCVALLAASTIVAAIPPLADRLMHVDYVLVKNPATQSGEFVTCIFGLLYLASDAFERRRWLWVAAFTVVIFGMLSNVFFVATGRTALVVIPVLLVLLAVRKLRARGAAVIFGGAIILSVAGWYSSPYLRERTEAVWTELQKYEATGTSTSTGERIEFWKKSVEFIRQAPMLGHGTGSIRSLFERSAVGQTGAAGVAAANPHNQTFAVAIQLGLIGAAALWAMWVAHLLLFRGDGLVQWVGLIVVVQNVVGSLFNSHLFDFVQGWVYVIGVGVAGGTALKARAMSSAPTAAR